MSEVPNDLAFDDNSDVGAVAEESSSLVADQKSSKKKKSRNIGGQFSLFNTILLVSFLFITLAVMLMLSHLFDRFGPFWDAPWNVSR